MTYKDGLFNLTIDFGYHAKTHGTSNVFLNKVEGVRVIKKEKSFGEITEHTCKI